MTLTLSHVIHAGKQRLREADIPAFTLDAVILASHAFGKSRERQLLDGDKSVSAEQAGHFRTLIERRAAYEPVAYITGEKPFRRHIFTVTRDTLIPRPDSECLLDSAEEMFAHRQHKPLHILDICTGSGCLLLSALAAFPNATGIGTDISPEALRVAVINSERTGTTARAEFICADLTDGLSGQFDMIFCNPPYICEGDKPSLAPDITLYEPGLALFAGVDGLDLYRLLFPALSALLAKEGAVYVECGDEQTEAISVLADASGLHTHHILHDLSGAPRGAVFKGYPKI